MLTLQTGDTLLLASDGLTEATVQADTQSGEAGMLRQAGLWRLIQQQPPPLDLDVLLQTIQGKRTQLEDDQTVLALEVM